MKLNSLKQSIIYKIFRLIKIKTSGIRNLLSLYLIHFFKKNVIFHYGVFGNKINVGDNILYYKLEGIADKLFKENQVWVHRNLHAGKITFLEILLINKISKAIIIGGHGLLMVDTNKNKNSGWQYNISIKNLKKLKVPIVITAIGYNRFRNQQDFIPIFKEHITWLVENSLHFGLRNYGSINALKKYIPERLHDKLIFQPCPTTMISSFFPELITETRERKKKVGICVAFDRYQNRFGDNPVRIFNDIFKFSEKLKDENIHVEFFIHNKTDLQNMIASKIFEKNGYKLFPLYKLTENEIYDYYQNFELIAGMRGHSLMIPYGLQVPILSLTTQDKQKWFIESIKHPEWNIEVESDFSTVLYRQTKKVLRDIDQVKADISLMQSEFKKITIENFEFIKSNIN